MACWDMPHALNSATYLGAEDARVRSRRRCNSSCVSIVHICRRLLLRSHIRAAWHKLCCCGEKGLTPRSQQLVTEDCGCRGSGGLLQAADCAVPVGCHALKDACNLGAGRLCCRGASCWECLSATADAQTGCTGMIPSTTCRLDTVAVGQACILWPSCPRRSRLRLLLHHRNVMSRHWAAKSGGRLAGCCPALAL